MAKISPEEPSQEYQEDLVALRAWVEEYIEVHFESEKRWFLSNYESSDSEGAHRFLEKVRNQIHETLRNPETEFLWRRHLPNSNAVWLSNRAKYGDEELPISHFFDAFATKSELTFPDLRHLLSKKPEEENVHQLNAHVLYEFEKWLTNLGHVEGATKESNARKNKRWSEPLNDKAIEDLRSLLKAKCSSIGKREPWLVTAEGKWRSTKKNLCVLYDVLTRQGWIKTSGGLLPNRRWLAQQLGCDATGSTFKGEIDYMHKEEDLRDVLLELIQPR